MPNFTADTIRILVATDSHVGYEERDAIRGDDSWKSFHEIMCLAKSEDVDMILLAGDLFHDNKPSRKALYQVMRSLRMNCLGEKPCELEMLSDAGDIFEGAFNHVNYEDEDINIAIPVFSIHGNHDDPAGDGHFCSLDLLQVSGLLNYIGRTPESDNISVKPVLLQKGQTKLALYGMSNVRDERLFRTFRDGKVRFFNPGVQKNDWFNLMAVHQNHHAHTETGYLPENFLPEFLDLVVWGHEHECLIDPRLNPETGFQVMQPGSSVATSLVAGEAVPKHVAIVSVTGRDFKVTPHRIKSVRPFITKEIALANEKAFKGVDKMKDNKHEVTKRLMVIVEKMIKEAKEEWLAIQDDDDEDVVEAPLPLVRLKVEYSSVDNGKFDCENPQRFSNRFIGQVANQNDVVVFHRKKKGTAKDKLTSVDMPDDSAIASMAIDTVKIDKLVQEFLDAQSLKILPQGQFGDAVTQFVDKDDKHAMEQFVEESLHGQVKQLLDLEADDDDLDTQMDRYRAQVEQSYAANPRKSRGSRKLKPKPDNWDTDMDGAWEDQPGAFEFQDPGEPEEASALGRGRGRISAAASDDDSVFGGPTARKATAKRAPAAKKAPVKKAPVKKAAGRAPAKGRKKAPTPPSADEDEDEDMIMLDSPPPQALPKRAAAARSTGRQTQLSFSQAARKPQAKEPSPDEISDDDDDAFEPMSHSARRR